MKEVIMYKCEYCGEAYEAKEDAIYCEKICKKQLECTHERIESRFLYGGGPDDYVCVICNKHGHEDYLRYERKQRQNGVFEKQDKSLEGWLKEEMEFRKRMKEITYR